MAKFLPNGSLYLFLGVAGVLFAMMLTCFAFYKGRERYRKSKAKRTVLQHDKSFKRRTNRNRFLKKRGEHADNDEENGAAESNADKIKAEIDSKYNNPIVVWTLSQEISENANDSDIVEG